MAVAPHPDQPARPAGAGREPRDRGVGLFAAFTAATLFMVGTIAAVGLVRAWWLLALVMLVDLAVTYGVVSGIGRLLADEGDDEDAAL